MADESPRSPGGRRAPSGPGGHEAVDLGDDDGPVTYQACDFADLDRVGDRDAVPVYNVDPRNGTPKRGSRTEAGRALAAALAAPVADGGGPAAREDDDVRGLRRAGVTYDEAAGPPPPPPPRVRRPTRATPRRTDSDHQDDWATASSGSRRGRASGRTAAGPGRGRPPAGRSSVVTEGRHGTIPSHACRQSPFVGCDRTYNKRPHRLPQTSHRTSAAPRPSRWPGRP